MHERFNSDRAVYFLCRTTAAQAYRPSHFDLHRTVGVRDITHPSPEWWICAVYVPLRRLLYSRICAQKRTMIACATAAAAAQPNIMASYIESAINEWRRSSKWACFTIMCQGCSRYSFSLYATDSCHKANSFWNCVFFPAPTVQFYCVFLHFF